MPVTRQQKQSLFDHDDGEFVDWILIFDDVNETPPWWARRLKAGFRHVSAVRWDGYNWIMVAPLLGVVRVEILPYRYHERPETWWPSHGDQPATFLHVRRKVRNNSRNNPFYFVPATCVEIIKSLLGLRKCTILTPYRLYHYLRSAENDEFAKR